MKTNTLFDSSSGNLPEDPVETWRRLMHRAQLQCYLGCNLCIFIFPLSAHFFPLSLFCALHNHSVWTTVCSTHLRRNKSLFWKQENNLSLFFLSAWWGIAWGCFPPPQVLCVPASPIKTDNEERWPLNINEFWRNFWTEFTKLLGASIFTVSN